jgi:predicted acetyltransferase
MSHFTVLVKVNADRLVKHNGNIIEAVAEMLSPYREGDCPQEHMKFNDCTAEVVEETSGEIAKEIAEEVESDNRSGLERLAEVAKRFGYVEHEGKYGYWENPNSKWDWYQIGGRWTGLLPVVEDAVTAMNGEPGLMTEENSDTNYADIVIVQELDRNRMNLDVEEGINKFWDKYQRILKINNGEINPTEDDRWLEYEVNYILSNIGIRRCVREEARDNNGQITVDPLYEIDPFTIDDLRNKYRWNWEFSTYAVVDDDGWHEKGKMGWWGVSSESVEEAERWDKSYVNAFINSEELDTILVVVDAHI